MMNEDIRRKIEELCVSGLLNDGGHHKQYFLEQILAEVADPEAVKAQLDAEGYSWERGIAP